MSVLEDGLLVVLARVRDPLRSSGVHLLGWCVLLEDGLGLNRAEMGASDYPLFLSLIEILRMLVLGVLLLARPRKLMLVRLPGFPSIFRLLL